MTAARKFHSNDMLFVMKAKQGISAQKVGEIMEKTEQNKTFFAEILEISVKTFDRYLKENRIFNASESEKLMKLEEVYDWGKTVFGYVSDFNRWIEKESYGLDYQVPRKLMQTVSGMNLVQDELVRIAYGDLA
ncbi:MAG: antitoxin Xre/MbcA/ParS toxin-binding domain-containing protein [Spirosomataceae bacterium]